MFNSGNLKSQMSNVVQWASSGTKLTYAAISIGLLLALVLYKLFFKDMGGLFHSIGFSVSSKGELGQDKSSRYKLFFALIIPPAAAYGAYIMLPKWLPTVFQ
jgi:hypothetical protein